MCKIMVIAALPLLGNYHVLQDIRAEITQLSQLHN